MGPIQIYLLGFEDFRATGGIADELISLSDAGTVRIIDARFLVKENEEVVALRINDLRDTEREDLRAAARALVDLVAGSVLEGGEGAEGRLVLGADAVLGVGEVGLSSTELGELADEFAGVDALLLLVIENLWAAGFANALRDAGIVSAQQDYLSAEGLISLGAMLGIDVALAG
ncbi:MAG: hypothetical protein ACR2OH_01860 [Microthrixaceae bacterium]